MRLWNGPPIYPLMMNMGCWPYSFRIIGPSQILGTTKLTLASRCGPFPAQASPTSLCLQHRWGSWFADAQPVLHPGSGPGLSRILEGTTISGVMCLISLSCRSSQKAGSVLPSWSLDSFCPSSQVYSLFLYNLVHLMGGGVWGKRCLCSNGWL